MTIPTDVKNKTVSNTNISENKTVSDKAVTTNTVIASASQGFQSSIYIIKWVFCEYLNHPLSTIFHYIDDLIVHDDKESSQQ